MLRILFNIILLLSVIYLPLWFTLVFGILFAFIISHRFYEFLYIGFLLDAIYGSYTLSFLHIPRFLVLGILLLFLIDFFKKRMNVYV